MISIAADRATSFDTACGLPRANRVLGGLKFDGSGSGSGKRNRNSCFVREVNNIDRHPEKTKAPAPSPTP
jgi:hypothetical protein